MVEAGFPNCAAIHATLLPDSIQNWICLRIVMSMCFAMAVFPFLLSSGFGARHSPRVRRRDAHMISNLQRIMQVNAISLPGEGGLLL